MSGDKDEIKALRELGQRLQDLRAAKGGETQAKFAARAGIKRSTYVQWETGARLPPVEDAIRFCKEYRLTLDWFYIGDPESLSPPLWEKIMIERRKRKPETD